MRSERGRSRSTMRRQPSAFRRAAGRCIVAAALLLAPGCRNPQEEGLSFLGEPQGSDYVAHATQVSFPDVASPGRPAHEYAEEPRRLRNPRIDAPWDLSLSETIHIALSNSQLILNSGSFLSPFNPLLGNPEALPSTYDSAIQESGVLFGQRGIEGALSEFDAQFTTGIVWGRNESIQNNRFTSGGLDPGDELVDETAQFNVGLQKRLANGAQFGVLHTWNYSGNNSPGRLFPSVYEGAVRAEYRQPLLAGGGVDFTRIAGPVSTNIQGVTGVQQGVIIARINNDITLADFELAVHSFLRDVENLYWQLHLAYRTLDAEERLYEDALEAWQVVEGRARGQAPGGGGAEYAEAREAYFRTQSRVLAARDNLYTTEAQLRRMIGLSVVDTRIIRPSDEPVSAEFLPDWSIALSEALARRPELRRQKWTITSIDLQRRAADNLTLPRLDLVGAYSVNGFGDRLLGNTDDGVSGKHLGNAYDSIINNDQTGWNLGFEFSVPVGRRFALAQVRNLELRLAKAQQALELQEQEVSHEVAAAFRTLDRTYLQAAAAYNHWMAADDLLEALRDQYAIDSRRTTVDMVLRAREMSAQSELQFVQSLIEYNTAITDLHYRTGRLLEVNGITLSEGVWTPDAYRDAGERARHRDYALDNPFQTTAPEELSGPRPEDAPAAADGGLTPDFFEGE